MLEQIRIEPVDPTLHLPTQQEQRIEPVDPTLHLPIQQEIRIDPGYPNLDLLAPQEKINIQNINVLKTRLSLELLNEIIENPTISEQEKNRYRNIRDQISNHNSPYYVYDDINLNMHQIINENQEIMNKPSLIIIPENINYDVELYKIGQKCSGSKKRFAIIKRAGFFSS